MKQTSFIWQVSIGIRQELQALVHKPSKLLLFYSTVIVFTFMNIWEHKHIEGSPESQSVARTLLSAKELSLLPLFYLGPEIVLSQKFIKEQKFKIKDFLITNGMKASAYTTKTLFACYFLLLPVASAKVIEVYTLNSLHKNHEEQKSLMFGIFINHLIAGFAIVNLNFFVSRILSEKYIIPFILVRALLPFYSLIFSYYLDSLNEHESTILDDAIKIIIGIINPTTPLTTSITELSKHVFCEKACVHYNSINITDPHSYTDYPQCMELFIGNEWNVVTDIDKYCGSKKGFHWLFYIKTAIIAGFTYLIFLFLLNQMYKFKDWMFKKFRQHRIQRKSHESLLSGIGSNASSGNSSFSLDVSQELPRRHTILKDANIKVRQEEILCILGGNEAGQSTLARILAGLSSPENGSINYNGREYSPAELSSLIGYCSQKDMSLRDNTIDENLKFFIRLKGSDQDLETIKKQVGLTRHDGPLLVSELSADQRMMLNVAIVLLSNPQILIMDEPTAELDSSTKVTFKKLLKDLKNLEEKKTIIFTAQSVKDAELADRIAILEEDGNTSGTLSHVKEKKLQGQYTLIISIRDKEAKQNVQDIIEDHLVHHILLDDTIDSILKYRVSYTENKDKLRELFKKLADISNIEVSFKRLSLDEYLEKRQDPSLFSRQIKTKIIPATNQYNLTTQILAIFLRRFYTWKQRKMLMALFYLLVSLLFGVFLLAKYYLRDYIAIFNLSLHLSFISVILCGYITMIFTGSELINHRRSHQIHALNIMGLKPWAYWLGNLFADLISHSPLIIFCLILIQYIDAQDVYERILLAIATITLYIDLIVFIYSLSVNKYVRSLQRILLTTFFAFLIGIATSRAAVLILNSAGITEKIHILVICTLSELLASCLIIYYSKPPFQIVMGIHIMSGILGRFFDKFKDPTSTSWPKLNQVILISITWLSIFMTLLCIVLKNNKDFKKYKAKAQAVFQPPETPNITILDEQTRKDSSNSDQLVNPRKTTILDERNRVKTFDNTDFLKFTNVYKKESLISDLKIFDVTFGVPKGTILALVGDNRGGKSEVLDLYRRHTFVSHGRILLQGQDLPCLPYKFSKVKIGFCLPTNAFWEDLSPREHLKIYARIKGIPSSMISEAAQEIISALDLDQYADISVKDIKEETVKRKLSVGLAVLGAPGLTILEEPTKGMDPAGRNQVWKVLKELVSKDSTILMATNQMEDAEFKADRTGIMIDGRLEKIDPVDRVKREKTDFYLKIEGIKKGENASLKERILSLDKQFKVFQENAREGKLTFIIPKQKAKSNLWKVFETLSEDLDAREIRDFSFSEKSLGEVFEDLAKNIRQKKQEQNCSG